MKALKTVDGETLTNAVLEPIKFTVNELLPQSGLFILAGAPKTGKSWLSLQLSLCVGKGEKFLEQDTVQSGVLYLCLEDSYSRIQTRLFEITEEAPNTIHFTNSADTIGNGLEQQIEKFVSVHANTKLIIIDTLQMVRSATTESSYGNDYRELTVLKTLADRLGIAILLVHHTRKTKSSDPQDMISGTNGLAGCADGSFVLERNKNNEATLYVRGRDIENKEIEMIFSNKTCTWSCENSALSDTDNFVENIFNFMSERKSFSGTASELLELIQPMFHKELFANKLRGMFTMNASELREYGISFNFHRSNGRNVYELKIV